ncbi:MAG TPA: CPBP family intramembrane glutamic endopeptidase [Terriglobales bacterium]|nr:CPBP family intramembrane glutamic endopeptidase [Terriglobales bacterium]
MATNPNPLPEQSRYRLIAPIWHTLVVLLVLLALSASSARSHNLAGRAGASHIANYITVMAIEWFVVGFIWLGIRWRGVRLAELIGGAWPKPTAVMRDLGIAVLFLIASNFVLALLSHLLKATPNQAMRSIFPHGSTEVAVYLLLTLTAGVCEEIIFRGYLYVQFAGMTRSLTAGLVLQGLVFGAAHGYQGAKFMFIIFVYGCLFGLLALWRRSLRPGMVAHFLQDSTIGLAGRHLMR